MKIIKKEKGASAVEFAVVLPLLMILIFGIIEFSLVMYNKAVITNASREGARQGVVARYDHASGDCVPFTEEEISDIVTSYCGSYLVGFGDPKDAPSTTVNWTPALPSPCAANNPTTDLSVEVNYNYHFLVLPNFVSAIGNPIHLRAVTVMKMEYWR